jgi:hypothetical protein
MAKKPSSTSRRTQASSEKQHATASDGEYSPQAISPSSSDDLLVTYIAELLFQLLNSICYARDIPNPRYLPVKAHVKLRTTRELKQLAEAAARFFCDQTRKHPGRYVDQQSIEALKAMAIEQALAQWETRSK